MYGEEGITGEEIGGSFFLGAGGTEKNSENLQS
jgi:hypothetical protein